MTRLYRGYVPIDNSTKAALMPYADVADSALLTFEQVQGLEAYAGVLAPGIVLVDADTEADADALWNIIDAENLNSAVCETRKGLHALFRDPEGRVKKAVTGHLTASGVVVDYKLGDKNGLQVLKVDGKTRPVLLDPKDEIDVIPSYLLDIGPYKKGTKVVGTTFVGMGPGDGRNDELFKHILKLQGQGLAKDEIRDILRVINQHVFEEPVPNDEFDKITREDSFKKAAFFVKGEFQHHTFGDFMIAEHHIRKIDGQLHAYEAGIYVPGQGVVARLMQKEIVTLRRHERNEVIDYIETVLVNEESMHFKRESVSYVAFQNGLLNVITGELRGFDPEIPVLNKIPWDWNPDAEDELVDRTLDKMSCFDPEVRAVMEEMVGYCLYRRSEMGKAFIMTGGGSNGKSTFIAMMKEMLGSANVTHLETQMLGDRFNTAMLYGKLANLGDDISDEFMQGHQVSTFKKIATGDPVKAENKGETPFTFTPYCTLIFSANDVPRIRDKSNAMNRRLVIVPFNATFSYTDADYQSDIKYHLTQESAMQRLLVLAVNALRRVIDRDGFTESKAVAAELESFKIENDSVLSWLQDIEELDVLNERVADVYRRYSIWCSDSNLVAKGVPEFSKRICSQFELVSKQVRVGGKKERIYVKE